MADWLQPGRKEGRERAQAVQKRRLQAAALVPDLKTLLGDTAFGLELDKYDYQASDVTKLQAPLDRARQIVNCIYNDLTEINNTQIPEKISEMEAYQLMQPALRVESRAREVREAVKQAADFKNNLDVPKQNAKGQIDIVERKRLQTSSIVQDTRNIVRQLQEGRAENAPEIAAAYLTAEREITAANQLISAAQQALARKAWREAFDLSQRAGYLFGSAQEKIETVREAGQEFAHVAADAQALLDRTLQKLSAARTELTAKAALISDEPDFYLQRSVQRIGEARRALKQTPPQAMSAYRLATESNSLIEEALAQAKDEMQRLKSDRSEARQALRELQETVQTARSQLSSQRVVPVASNEMYRQARHEYERLADTKIDELKPDALEKVIGEVKAATDLAAQATKLLPSP